MTSAQIRAALEQGQPASVLIRSGGWCGNNRHVLRVDTPRPEHPDLWRIQIFNQDGVHLRDNWIEAENVIAVSIRFHQDRSLDETE
jgi:hypothetical protein